MSVHRSFRCIPILAVVAATGLGLVGSAPIAAAAATSRAVACPPDWLGTTTTVDPQISADGRYVVFTGYGPDGELGNRVIFLRDLKRGRTTVVSDPDQVRYDFLPSISADGTRISYLDRATDDFGNEAEIWVYDRRTGVRTDEGVSFTQSPALLDAHGRHLTYTRLDDGDTNHVSVFVRDVYRDRTTLVSADPAGEPANNTSIDPDLSADGNLVLFWSEATDLTENAADVGNNGALFVRNVRTGTTTLIPDRSGKSSSVYRFGQHLSPDGRYVLFTDPDGVWRYDRRTGKTVAASKPRSTEFDSSADIGTAGRRVLLETSGGLVVRNVRTGAQIRVDRRPNGTPPSESGYPGAMTPDGRYVVFYTTATDLDPKRTGQGYTNIYVRDLRRGTTRLASTTDAGGACSAR